MLSVGDYYAATGDVAAVAFLTPNIVDHLGQAIAQWPKPGFLRFVGWASSGAPPRSRKPQPLTTTEPSPRRLHSQDDRIGSGFANSSTPETIALYRLLTIRALTVASGFFGSTGNALLAAQYAGAAENFTAMMRAMGGDPWYGSFGLHASADAVNAGFLTPDEQIGIIAAGQLGDTVTLPSQSNFNQ